MKKAKRSVHSRNTLLITIAFIAIMLSPTTVLPISAAPRQLTASDYQKILENGFVTWSKSKGINLNKQMSTEVVQDLFMQFLNDKPDYKDVLQKWDELQNIQTVDTRTTLPDMVPFEEIVQYGQIVAEWNAVQTIEGTGYLLVMREYVLNDYGIVKVTVYTSDGTVVTDPYVYVVIVPIKIWVLWWEVQVGEDGWLYEFFVSTNNEALRFKTDMINQMIATGFITGVIVGMVAAAGFPPIALVGIYMGAWISYAINEINAAYSSWGNQFYIIFYNHYMYTLVGCSFALYTVWNDYSTHYIWPDPLTGASYILNPLSAINAQIQSSALHSIGDRYGYNRWVWVGYY